MILKHFFRDTAAPERSVYAAIVAAARHPLPYVSWGVADDIDGRFNMIVLHMFLVLDRLKGEDPLFRQHLVDEFFADMDRSLREMGVGDISVGKKVRKMAEAFYGRVAAYDMGSVESRDALAAALSRNFFPEGNGSGAEKLADFTLAARAHLARTATNRLLGGNIDFPEPQP